MKLSLSLLVTLTIAGTGAQAEVVDELFTRYRALGAAQAVVEHGRQQWTQVYTNNKKGENRSCVTCHTKDLRSMGKHVGTGKPIEALAPSVNPERLTDSKKIEKWFKRNCKWTLGRECNAQEKTDFLSYIQSQ